MINEDKQKKQISSHFQCKICYQNFNQKQNFPRLLICGHTFCQKCISIIINQRQTFTCPYCSTKLGQLRLGQTYKNYIVLNLLEINGIEGGTQKKGQIIRETFQQIVEQMDKMDKRINTLIIKRTRDDEANPFEFDLIRSNKNSMRFYKLLVLFQRLEHFEFWVKFSAHGFEQCLAESLYEIKSLKSVKIVNQYDQYERLRQVISLTGNQKIKFEVNVVKWDA